MRRSALLLLALWSASCNSILGNKELHLVGADGGSDTGATTGGTDQNQSGSSSGGTTTTLGNAGASSGATQGGGATAGTGGVVPGGGSGSLGGSGSKAGAAGTGGSGPECPSACVTGATCESGACTCGMGMTICLDTCADLQTDKNNCGTCQKTCTSGCSVGRCMTTLATSAANDNLYLAVNATDVYFTMRDAGTVSRVSRSGGTVRVIAASQNRPMGIALDATNIYWVNQGVGNAGQVMKLPISLGSPTPLASNELYPQGIAVDASNVYWTNFAGLGSATVMKVPISGSDSDKVTLASGTLMANTEDLVIDGTYAYFVNYGDGPNSGNVMKVLLAGGAAPVVLADNVDSPTAIAVHGSTIYFTLAGMIEKISVNGGAVAPVATLHAAQIAVDDSGIYVTGAGANGADLVKLTLNGGSPVTLASDRAPTSLVLDSSDVFWATGVNSAVRFTSKTP